MTAPVDVVEIVGVTQRQVEFWISQGYLNATSPGSGHTRTWPETEIAVAQLMARLVNDAGFQPAAAAEHARVLLRQAVYGTAMRLELAPGITLEVTP